MAAAFVLRSSQKSLPASCALVLVVLPLMPLLLSPARIVLAGDDVLVGETNASKVGSLTLPLVGLLLATVPRLLPTAVQRVRLEGCGH